MFTSKGWKVLVLSITLSAAFTAATAQDKGTAAGTPVIWEQVPIAEVVGTARALALLTVRRCGGHL